MLGALMAGCVSSLGCEPGNVGHPCVPEQEYRSGFSGFAVTEAYMESRSFQCETRVCLVNHFQGRASCPYGQTEADLSLAAEDAARCRVPGTDGSREGDAIEVPVAAWRVDRPADDAVYCSCRCDGPDPNARYCECPSGFACAELVPDMNLEREQLAGSYCIKDGTRYEPGPSLDCRTNPDHAGCPEPVGVNP